MASAAYRPDQTQAPYQGWFPVGRDHQLQADERLRSYDVGIMEFTWPRPAAVDDQPLHSAPTEFKKSYDQWLQDSRFDSLPDRMRRHSSYKRIVAMGDRVVPLIAAELRKKPSFLFLALEDIKQADPVPEDAFGNLRKTVDEWLSWLRR
jgi:hypothetical protein